MSHKPFPLYQRLILYLVAAWIPWCCVRRPFFRQWQDWPSRGPASSTESPARSLVAPSPLKHTKEHHYIMLPPYKAHCTLLTWLQFLSYDSKCVKCHFYTRMQGQTGKCELVVRGWGGSQLTACPNSWGYSWHPKTSPYSFCLPQSFPVLVSLLPCPRTTIDLIVHFGHFSDK